MTTPALPSGLEVSGSFQPAPGEANFGPPLPFFEVVHGLHIAPEVITRRGEEYVMTVWPKGLPRHETTRTARFPHGLMLFGETLEQCASRLVKNQQGFSVERCTVVHIDSFLDDAGHWHLEPWILTEVCGPPVLPPEASELVYFKPSEIPQDALWTADDFAEFVAAYDRFLD